MVLVVPLLKCIIAYFVNVHFSKEPFGATCFELVLTIVNAMIIITKYIVKLPRISFL